MQKSLPLLLMLLLTGTPQFAHGDWQQWGGPLMRDAPVKLEPAPAGPLVLLARNLVVYDGEVPRRAFTVNLQNDAMVDLSASGDTLLVATRRTLWRSDDRGFSWRKLITLAPRDPDEWLAIMHDENGRTLAASRTGLKLVSPGSAVPAGALGRVRIESAHHYGRHLLLQTPRGLFAVSDQTEGLPLSPLGAVAAYQAQGDEHWIADGRSVLRCTLASCVSEADLAGVRAMARGAGAYWLASTDAVWRRGTGEKAWQRVTEGLGAARPVALREAAGRIFALTDRGLYAWFLPPTAPADTNVYLPETRPSMAEVRRMVLDSVAELRAGRLSNWRERARWRAAAPQVGLSVRRSHDDRASRTVGNTVVLSTSENRILIGPDGESITDANSRGLDYGLSLSWSLDDLVFNSQELSVSNELEDNFRLRESILLDVTRLYFDRMRTLTQLQRETDPLRKAELTLRAAELAAEIDFYTEGRFSRALEEAP